MSNVKVFPKHDGRLTSRTRLIKWIHMLLISIPTHLKKKKKKKKSQKTMILRIRAHTRTHTHAHTHTHTHTCTLAHSSSHDRTHTTHIHTHTHARTHARTHTHTCSNGHGGMQVSIKNPRTWKSFINLLTSVTDRLPLYRSTVVDVCTTYCQKFKRKTILEWL